MPHHLERNHGPRFAKLMDRSVSNWRSARDQLNDAPLAHEEWGRTSAHMS
ncbi:YgjP-like metallopeptidase domain-containing protein [Longispora sp. K20-0274]